MGSGTDERMERSEMKEITDVFRHELLMRPWLPINTRALEGTASKNGREEQHSTFILDMDPGSHDSDSLDR